MPRGVYGIWVLCFSLAVGLTIACGEVTYLGPTPYLSSDDSPFDLLGQGADFFVEDFEDGSFDLPFGVGTLPYSVRAPSPTTDSVDADDGSIDGSGTGGYSLRPDFIYFTFDFPTTWYQQLELTFNREQLGFLPNSFGFVWTDGPGPAPPGESYPRVQFLVFDEMGVPAAPVLVLPSIMDDNSLGGTAEDRFVGVIASGGISRVTISNVFRGFDFVDHFEIDHIQFGVWVPEPSIGFAFVIFSSLTVLWQIRRKKELTDEFWQIGGGR